MTRFRLEYALPFFSVAFCAAFVWAGEGVLKHRYPTLLNRRMDHSDEFDMFYRFHPRLGRWHKPGFSGTYRGHVYTINRNGLRDTETPYQAAAPRRRIVMLGDSVTWGYGVDDSQTFSDLLERALVNADVINVSASGYGTGEELLLLKEEGLKYAPDTVVLVFCIANDVEDTYFRGEAPFPTNTFYLENGALKIRPIRLSWRQRIGIAVSERSYLVNFFLKKVFTRFGWRQGEAIKQLNRNNRKSVDGDLASFGGLTYLRAEPQLRQDQSGEREHLLPPTPASYYKVELTKRVLEEMADVVRRSGATFVVVLSPFQSQLNPDDPAFHNPLNAELMRFFAEQKIRAVDLLPRFLERGDDPDEIFGDNTHYSAEGHRVVAALLQELLAGVQPAGPR